MLTGTDTIIIPACIGFHSAYCDNHKPKSRLLIPTINDIRELQRFEYLDNGYYVNCISQSGYRL